YFQALANDVIIHPYLAIEPALPPLLTSILSYRSFIDRTKPPRSLRPAMIRTAAPAPLSLGGDQRGTLTTKLGRFLGGTTHFQDLSISRTSSYTSDNAPPSASPTSPRRMSF